jgi:DNA polymerase-3 subunit alpha
MVRSDRDLEKLMDYARRLEGTARSAGTHAAGVVIADRPLIDLVPLQKLPNKDKTKEVVSTQWEMGDIEKAGLLKVDFLGLRNLTGLAACVKLVRERHGRDIHLPGLAFDDAETYRMLQRGEAQGVFQLEGAGIRDTLVKMAPDRFGDLVAVLALYRPGPLNSGMVDTYIDCKHGREEPRRVHPIMDEILKDTYSVITYQEQVMQILHRLGGVGLSAAYAVIKAISKKKIEGIQKGRDQFLRGSGDNGLAADTGREIWGVIEGFSEYAFNRAHSTAYAQVLFWTAYLKCHYPVEFMASVLSSEMDGANRDKFLVSHVEDARRMGLAVLPPDVNRSEAGFSVVDEKTIRFGLGAIKGIGEKAVAAVVAGRRARPYRGWGDFFERVPHGEVGAACAETLVQAGAFDGMGLRRSQLLDLLKQAHRHGKRAQADRARGQTSIFDVIEDDEDRAPDRARDLPELPAITLLAHEKKALGFYLTRHPMETIEGVAATLRSHTLAGLVDLPERAVGTVVALVTSCIPRTIQNSRSAHNRMGKLTLEDLTGTVPALLWPEEFARFEATVAEDSLIVAQGTLDRRREPPEFIITHACPAHEAIAREARKVVVTLDCGVHGPEALESLRAALDGRRGPLGFYLEIKGLPGVARALYDVPSSHLSAAYTPDLVGILERAVGPGCVRLLARAPRVAAPAVAAGPRRW